MTLRTARGAAALALTMAGCTASLEQDETVNLEVYSWWTSGGEKDALGELDRVNHQRHPNVRLAPLAADAADAAYSRLDVRLAYRLPPDTFQANAGSNLLSRVLLDRDASPGEVESSRLADLGKLFAQAEERIWPELASAVQVAGRPYGVPLDLHRTNNLYFNSEKLSGHALPTDLTGFQTLVAQLSLERSGPALGIGVRDNWTLEELVFENLLPSVTVATDPHFYEQFWQGALSLDGESSTRAQLELALKAAQELWPHTRRIGEDASERERGKWSDAFDLMMDPSSSVSLVVMGDWATGYLESTGFQVGQDFGVVPFPGTDPLYIFTSDVFPLPIGARHPTETVDLLKTVLTWDAQVAINRKKGGIPAVDPRSSERAQAFAPDGEARIRAFEDAPVRSLAMSGLVTPDMPPDLLRKALQDMFKEEDAATGRDIVLFALSNHYWMLKLWPEALSKLNP